MASQTWFITGCSTGFGRALAELLLEQGERVVVTARKPERLEVLVAAHGERALALPLDVTRAEDIERAVGEALWRFGTIDVLINNAGYGLIGTVEDQPLEAARAMMETHFFAALAIIKTVLPEMRRRRSGQIVNIGSVAGQIGFPALGYYCASKYALAGLTESLAAEVRGLGIKVTLAELGPFATEFTQSMGFTPPSSADYDLAALAVIAGNSEWGAGDDPAKGARALLAALRDPAPPLHLILGQAGLDVVARHDAIRAAEREQWLAVSRLEAGGSP
jgi:NAD(P)-dependent dehydrogenase (short-subunit alcohol dehydrogenase family)